MNFTSLIHPSGDLLITIVASLSVMALGLVVFLNNKTNKTQRSFFYLSIIAGIYILINYFSRFPYSPQTQLLLLRWVIFFATWYSFFLFHLFYVFPSTTKKFSRLYFWGVVIPTIFLASLTLTPMIFQSVGNISDQGLVTTLNYGLLIPLFGIGIISLVFGGLFMLWKKMRNAVGKERIQFKILFIGTIITYTLLIIFNVIFPIVLENSLFVIYAPFFNLPFIIFAAYAIFKYELFSIKVIATQFFVFILGILYFSKIFSSASNKEVVLNIFILLATIIFGSLLIRSVKKEITIRQEMQSLAKRLAETNWQLARTNEELRIIDQRKSEFVSIVSHQLRTPITAIKGYSSMLLEGSFGNISDEVRTSVKKIFSSSERLANMVSDFLDISKIEQGTMTYNFASVDLGAMVNDLIEEFLPTVKAKGLELHKNIPSDMPFIVTADEGKIRQIISNLLDNAIKYTPSGGIVVTLEEDRPRGKIRLSIKDSGIGLSQDDIHHLFGKFTRGSGGQKENTSGSGLGLYVAKKMLEAHHGNIWVDSEGIGKGSTFVLELLEEEQ